MVENTWRLSVLISDGQNIQGTLCNRSPWDEGCSIYFFLFIFHCSESKASIENASGNTITSAYYLAYLRSSSSGAHTSTPPHQHSHCPPLKPTSSQQSKAPILVV